MCQYIIKNIYCICCSLLCIFTAVAEESLPPANYIGIYDSWAGYKNGSIPIHSKSAKYTGYWKGNCKNNLEYIEGFYREGIPWGTWTLHLNNGFLKVLCNYSSDTYVYNVFYPDGALIHQEYGKIKRGIDIFDRIPQKSRTWDSLGNIILNSPKAKANGWSLIKEPETYFHRNYIIDDFVVSIYLMYLDNKKMQLSLYLLTQDGAFYGKKILTYRLDEKNGRFIKAQETIWGNYSILNETISLDHGSDNLDLTNGEKKIQIQCYLKIENESVNTNIFSIRVKRY